MNGGPPHADTASSSTSTNVAAAPVFRPPDTRPVHDDARLRELGILRFESKHLRLYTDIEPEIARTLPPLIDQAYEAWVDYFGPLPPNREGTPFQVTGYIMRDQRPFRETGLLPRDLPPFQNGRHRGAEFWMNDQQTDYYRRHLVIHEATHCFMTIMPGVRLPVWYLEGMAELFGAHIIDATGKATFRVMPHDVASFPGFGRIHLIRDEVKAGRPLSLDGVFRLQPNDYLQAEAYAWSWALCKLLDTHPRYSERFRELGQHTTGSAFPRAFARLFGPDLDDLRWEWSLFVRDLRPGFDIERAAVEFRPGTPLEQDGRRISVRADRGWQSSGILLEKGAVYEITAQGRSVLAESPGPWISEPPGISIRYHNGQPLGRLLATLRPDPRGNSDTAEVIPVVIPVGRYARFAAPMDGTLYFRINDFFAELADNTGRYTVEIRRDPKPSASRDDISTAP